MIVLVCADFGLLTSAPTGTNIALLVPLPLAFALGVPWRCASGAGTRGPTGD
ncbi:hypothetical protein [Streptomyces sirii]|uniref:hypothetical protein n=1 Tax=Streptomyces sirii TaxID=3127701 RepID=UPI003D35A1CC